MFGPNNPFGFQPAGPSNVFGSATRPVLSVADRCAGLGGDASAQHLASTRGLSIGRVAWEDCARTKGSVWGPCISDMTLHCEGRSMPIMRSPNYTDFTFDAPMDSIKLVVGNEVELPFGAAAAGGAEAPPAELKSVSLSEYLRGIGAYTGISPGDLWAPRDTHALCSTQACFVPLEQGVAAHTDFTVDLYNYQSRPSDPAVLVLVASSKGTSAQVSDGTRGGQKLHFNDRGVRKPFRAVRLTQDRIERGVAVEGPMTAQEKQDNALLVIQVPLKQKQEPVRTFGFGGAPAMAGFGAATGMGANQALFGGAAPPMGQAFGSMALGADTGLCMSKGKVDVEHAIVRLGDASGPFPSLRGMRLERDTRFPVRVTIQFYKATGSGEINAAVVDEIAAQMAEARSNAAFMGSLVTGGFTFRPTEAIIPQPSPPLFPGQPSPTPPQPGPVVHVGITCDGCGRSPLPGPIRYKCLNCPNYDLCAQCEERLAVSQGAPGTSQAFPSGAVPPPVSSTLPVHPPTHVFIKMRREVGFYGPNHLLHDRSNLSHPRITCDGCQKLLSGTRFKCTVCPDFDMCEGCLLSTGHSATYRHPMIMSFFPM